MLYVQAVQDIVAVTEIVALTHIVQRVFGIHSEYPILHDESQSVLQERPVTTGQKASMQLPIEHTGV